MSRRDAMNEPEKAFDALLAMAKTNDIWVNLKRDVIAWAKDNYSLTLLITAIEDRLDRGEISDEYISEFYGYVKALKEIRGY